MSLEARLAPICTSRLRSATSAALDTARLGLPAAAIALIRSAWASALAAYRSALAVSPSSFSGSRHRSWSPRKLPEELPEPTPTCRYRVLVPWSQTWLSQPEPKCASLSKVDGDAEPRARSAAYRTMSPYAVVWVNFR